jgi:hypothetical protein
MHPNRFVPWPRRELSDKGLQSVFRKGHESLS